MATMYSATPMSWELLGDARMSLPHPETLSLTLGAYSPISTHSLSTHDHAAG